MRTVKNTFSWTIKPSAFSLAEVVIALAIAALGFVSLLGLLPQGMQMSRQAADLGARARITQQISAELNSTPWDKITWSTDYSQRRYFDDQGIEIPVETLSANPLALTYVACLQVPSGTGNLSKEVTLPVTAPVGNSAAAVQEPYMRRIRLYIATTSTPSFDFTSLPAGRIPYTTLILTKTGTEAVPN